MLKHNVKNINVLGTEGTQIINSNTNMFHQHKLQPRISEHVCCIPEIYLNLNMSQLQRSKTCCRHVNKWPSPLLV